MSTVAVSRKQITVDDLRPVGGIPLQLDIEASGISASAWAEEYQQDVGDILKANGPVLIRGLKVPGRTQFGKILSTLFGSELLESTSRSTPRTGLRGNVSTAPEYP